MLSLWELLHNRAYHIEILWDLFRRIPSIVSIFSIDFLTSFFFLVSSNLIIAEGLFIFDIAHMPSGCGNWPSIWLVGPNWPSGGEVNSMKHSQKHFADIFNSTDRYYRRSTWFLYQRNVYSHCWWMYTTTFRLHWFVYDVGKPS